MHILLVIQIWQPHLIIRGGIKPNGSYQTALSSIIDKSCLSMFFVNSVSLQSQDSKTPTLLKIKNTTRVFVKYFLLIVVTINNW